MKRIPLKGGDEYEALTRLRRVFSGFRRSGLAKKSKRKYNKRFRKAGKKEHQP